MKEALQDIIVKVRSAWRYRWHAMIAAWLLALVGWAGIGLIPDKYESNARIYVDTDSMLRPLLKGLAVQSDITQRLRLMTRTLLSRPNLEKVVRETDLDVYITSAKDRERLLRGLEKKILLSNTRQQNLYTISYQNKEPKLAKAVVQSLMNIFVESTLGDSRQDSSSAQRFLDQQINEYEVRLTEAENNLTGFKRENIGALPSQEGGIFQRFEQTKMKFEQTQLALREAQNTRDELERQLTIAESEESANNVPGEISRIDSRILALHTRLDELLLRFTKIHPDVVEIREKIATLKKQKKNSKRENYAASNTQAEGMTLVGELRLALGKSEAELAGIRVRGLNYQQKVLQLSELVKTLPQIETKLKRLQRGYDIIKQNYDLLVSRKESARMSESVGAVGDDVKFKIIDPPRLPILPISPNRPLFSIIVLLLSLGAGAGLAIGLSQIHPVVYDQTRLRNIAGLPVFGSVSRIWTPELIFKRKLEVGAFMAAGLVLVVVFAGVVLWQVMGGSGEQADAIRSVV